MANDLHNLPIGSSIRLGIIRSCADTFVEVGFFDRFGSNTVRCPIPQPYAGRGGGVLVGPEVDTMVILASGPMEKWFIVGSVPDTSFYTDIDSGGGGSGIRYNESAYPKMRSGEVCLKGNTGNRIDLLKSNNIGIDAGIGSKSYDIELSNLSQALYLRADNEYKFGESGFSIEGIVKRDLSQTEVRSQIGSVDMMTGESYERLLTEIGRSPSDEAEIRTTTLAKNTIRNPALIEKRNITYEYGGSYGVRGFDIEAKAMESTDSNNLTLGIENLQINPFDRNRRRTDTFNLNLRNYNALIEKVEGTAVDIYGNILDINRNIINVPGADIFEGKSNDSKALRRLYDYLRRSIKYHFEINSRKPISATEPALSDIEGIAKRHSRFSIDIDGEGFTKINVPSTSETGNIPVLGRYFNSRDPEDKDNGSFRDSDSRDVRIAQFGAQTEEGFAGLSVSNSEYLPKTISTEAAQKTVTVGTAYHDMLNVAQSIFNNGKFKNPTGEGDGVQPLSDTITNKIPEIGAESEANAGGRSIHMNLDGSMEMSIGADTLDTKSILMDLQGAHVSRFGRDKNNRSIIHQSDGDIILQVGGKGLKDGDGRFDKSEEDHPGRIEIHLNRGEDKEPQKIIIDENGITISVEGNAVYSSTGDTTISAGGSLLLHGENIFKYGTYDEEVQGTRAITGKERYAARNGHIIS